MNKNITITMSPDKIAKNSIRFGENVASQYVPEKIGEMYVQKSALAALGYDGEDISVEIGFTGDIKMMPTKGTKNAYQFSEETVSEFVPAKIGTMYVPKSTLAELEYTGDALYVTIKIVK